MKTLQPQLARAGERLVERYTPKLIFSQRNSGCCEGPPLEFSGLNVLAGLQGFWEFWWKDWVGARDPGQQMSHLAMFCRR